MKELEILKSTGMTEYDAKRHLKDGALIHEVEDYLKNFEEYAAELGEDDKAELREFLEVGKSGTLWDNDLTEHEGVKYYIEYLL